MRWVRSKSLRFSTPTIFSGSNFGIQFFPAMWADMGHAFPQNCHRKPGGKHSRWDGEQSDSENVDDPSDYFPRRGHWQDVPLIQLMSVWIHPTKEPRVSL